LIMPVSGYKNVPTGSGYKKEAGNLFPASALTPSVAGTG